MKRKTVISFIAAAALTAAVSALAFAAEAETEGLSESTGTEAAMSVEEVSTEEETETAAPASRAAYNALDYVEVGTYKGLNVEVDPIQVSEADIDAAISAAVSSADAYDQLTEGSVQDGDIANIDYEGKKDGVAFDGGTAQGTDLTIGSGMFIPGFESGLVGAKIGDTVDLNLTFPENYGNADLAGAEVVFTVKVNSVKRMPEVTDELVSKITDGDYKTVGEYREFQKQELTAEAEEARKSTVRNELMTMLYNTCKVNAHPQEVIDYEAARAKQYYETYAAYYGMELKDFISQMYGMEEDAFNSYMDSSIRSSLEQEMILGAIFETEGLEVTDAMFEEYCEKYAQTAGLENAADFKAQYDENLIRVSIKSEEAMNLVEENAVVTEKETEALTEGAESVAEAITEAVTE